MKLINKYTKNIYFIYQLFVLFNIKKNILK